MTKLTLRRAYTYLETNIVPRALLKLGYRPSNPRGRVRPSGEDFCMAVPFNYPISTQAGKPTIAIVCHLFYADLVSWLLEVAQESGLLADLYISTDTAEKKDAIDKVLSQWSRGSVDVRVVENRGRDIAPKLLTFADIYDRYDLVLFLHSKKSKHYDFGDSWRDFLVQCLAGSPAVATSILDIFRCCPEVGMVIPPHYHRLTDVTPIDWGSNFRRASWLARQMGFELSPDGYLELPSGSMFWARPAAFRPLLDLKLSIDDFPGDHGQLDGTLAHSIERLFLFACEKAGFTWVKVANKSLLAPEQPAAQIDQPTEIAAFIAQHRFDLLSAPGRAPMMESESVYPLNTDSLRQRSVRGAAITSVSQAMRFVIMLASQIVLARLLYPADFGIIAMVGPVLGFITVMADLGVTQAIVQRPVLTRGQLNSFFWINALINVALTAVMMLLAPLLAGLYHEARLIPVTLALASLVMVTGLSLQQTALLNRTMRFSVLAVSETLSLALGLGVSALAAWRGLGYWSLVLAQATTAITTVVVVWSASSWRPSWPSFGSDAHSMLRFGGNITVSNIAMYLNTVLDNGLVGYFLGEVLLGFYDRAWKLAVLPLSQLMAPINRVAIPALSRLTEEPERYKSAFGQMLRILLFVTLPGLAVGVLAARPLIGLLFGPRWNEVAPVFSWLCVGSLLTPVNTGMFWIFISQGRARDQKIYGSAAAVINILSYAVGVHWGIIGVARTSAIVSYLLPTPLLVWAASRNGPVGRGFFFHLVFPFVASTIGVLAVVKLYDHFLHIAGFIDLAAVAVISYLVTLPILACFPSGPRYSFEAYSRRQRTGPPGRLHTQQFSVSLTMTFQPSRVFAVPPH